MNSLLPIPRRNSYSLRLFVALLALTISGLPIQRAVADVSANISIWHGYDFYYPNLAGTTSTSAPVTFHWMENASGVLWKQIGGTNGVNGFWITNNLNAVIHECTNGLWKLYLNRGHASEELYFFKMSVTGVTTNVLGDVNITSPLSGSTGVTTQPTYQWTGPSNLPEIQFLPQRLGKFLWHHFARQCYVVVTRAADAGTEQFVCELLLQQLHGYHVHHADKRIGHAFAGLVSSRRCA
jgi:hypothetical protein